MESNLIRKLPLEGTHEDIYQRLYDYINPIDEKWATSLKGASEEDIKKLIDIVKNNHPNMDIPKSYIEFLKLMGEYDGELLSYWMNADATISMTLRNLISLEKSDECTIAIGESELFYKGYIKLLNDGTHRIISDADAEYNVDFVYDDFEKLLFMSAFEKYEMKYFDNVIFFGANNNAFESIIEKIGINDVLKVVSEYAENKGFKKLWFSDKYHLIMEKGNTTILVDVQYAIRGYINGDNKEELKELISEINEMLGTEIE